MSEEADPVGYTYLMNSLRNPRGGINMRSDTRVPSLVHVSFRSRVPDTSYKIVQATIDAIRVENKKTLEESVGASVAFLTRQISLYKDKMASVDAEMLNVIKELKEMADKLDPEQRDLIQRVTAEATIGQQAGGRAVAGETISTDPLAEIDMELSGARRSKKMLEKHIEEKDFRPESADQLQGRREDIFGKEIESKKLEIAELLAKGYLPAHPTVKRLQDGLRGTIETQEKYAKELAAFANREPTEAEKKRAERKMRDELEKQELNIETLEEKKKILEEHKKAAENVPIAETVLVGPVATKASKLKSLRDEKDILARYSYDLRKQLEDIDLRSMSEKSPVGFIVEVVEPPKMPVAPLPSQGTNNFVLGLIIAIGAGSALSYLVDSLDKSVRTSVELREKFKVPVIATIDRICTAEDLRAADARRNIIIISMAGLSAAAAAITAFAARVLNL